MNKKEKQILIEQYRKARADLNECIEVFGYGDRMTYRANATYLAIAKLCRLLKVEVA